MKFTIKKSKSFIKDGITTKGDEKTIDRIALDYVNDFKKKNKYRIEHDSAVIDGEVKNNQTWLDYLRTKKPNTPAKEIEVKWDILVYVQRIKKLKQLKVEIDALKVKSAAILSRNVEYGTRSEN